MEFTVHIFADERLIEPSDYKKFIIRNENVDMIINSIVEQAQGEAEKNTA